MRHVLLLILFLMPTFALAQAAEPVSFELILHGVIGAFGALSVVVFVAGFATYLARLGTERREEAIEIMEWGVSIMVVVILCAGIIYWMNT